MRNMQRDSGVVEGHLSHGAEMSLRPKEETKLLLNVRTNSLRGLLP